MTKTADHSVLSLHSNVLENDIPYIRELSNEEIHEYYELVKDIQDFSSWIMRVWFNPAKYADKAWFSVDITTENVLRHITCNPKFPYTPSQLVEIWRAIPKIQKGLNVTTADEDISAVENPVEGNVYKKGEQTLSSIGAELGNVSATMVKKMGDTAEEKIKKFFGSVSPSDMDSNEEDNLFEVVDIARLETAIEYVAALKQTNGNIKEFFTGLVKEQVLSSYEVDLISANEIQALVILGSMDSDVAEFVLAEDINEDENIFKTFQNAVSRKVFPAGKRGRPKKEVITD